MIELQIVGIIYTWIVVCGISFSFIFNNFFFSLIIYSVGARMGIICS